MVIENKTMTTDTCSKCDETKDLTLFVTGRHVCKDCSNKARRAKLKKQRDEKKDEPRTCTGCKETMSSLKFKVGSARCRPCEAKQKKARLAKAKAELPAKKTCVTCDNEQDSSRFRLGENVCKECQKEKLYEWRKDNPEKFHAICKTYRSKEGYREKNSAYKRQAYHSSPQDKASRKYRTMLRDFIFKTDGEPKKRALKIIGCSREYMRDWLEFNFKIGMTWDSYGSVWNLDHIKPCSSFDLTEDDQVEQCFAWSNTAPVYCKDNLKKFNKQDDDAVKEFSASRKRFEKKATQLAIRQNKAKKRLEKKKQDDSAKADCSDSDEKKPRRKSGPRKKRVKGQCAS